MGVLITGSHQSGTSAMAEMVSAFGFDAEVQPLPGQKVQAALGSRLSGLNDRLLASAGGPMFDPSNSVDSGELPDALGEELVSAFQSRFPDRRYVWSDPRLSVSLASWRQLPIQLDLVILMVREPLGASAALVAQGHVIERSQGLAVWESFTRSALRHCAGLPTLLVDYDEMLSDPTQTVDLVAQALERVGISEGPQPEPSAPAVSPPEVSLVDAGSSGQAIGVDEYPVDPEQRRLWEYISTIRGFHPALDSLVGRPMSSAGRQVLRLSNAVSPIGVAECTVDGDPGASSLRLIEENQVLRSALAAAEADRLQTSRELMAAVDGLRGAEAAKGAAMGRLALAEYQIESNIYQQEVWEAELDEIEEETAGLGLRALARSRCRRLPKPVKRVLRSALRIVR